MQITGQNLYYQNKQLGFSSVTITDKKHVAKYGAAFAQNLKDAIKELPKDITNTKKLEVFIGKHPQYSSADGVFVYADKHYNNFSCTETSDYEYLGRLDSRETIQKAILEAVEVARSRVSKEIIPPRKQQLDERKALKILNTEG